MEHQDLTDEQKANVIRFYDWLMSDAFLIECLEIDFEKYLKETGWIDYTGENTMEYPVEPVAYQANDASLQLILAAAYRLSIAANELKSIEDMQLEPDALSDAWEHAYSELYRANEEYKRANEATKPPPPEKR